MKQIFIIIFFLFIGFHSKEQPFYRIKADYSIKTKQNNTAGSLTMGTVYYDLRYNKMVYNNKFPEKEIWITQDSLWVRDKNGKQEKKMSPDVNKINIFYLLLNNKLKDFGLSDRGFTFNKFVTKDTLTLLYFIPPENLKNQISSLILAYKNNIFYGIVLKNTKEELVSRQIFRKYKIVSGLAIPSEIVQQTYLPNKQAITQITNYKNIVINDFTNNNMYNYPIH